MHRPFLPVAIFAALVSVGSACVGGTEGTGLPRNSLSWVEGIVTDTLGQAVVAAAIRPGEFAYRCDTGELASPPLTGLGATGSQGDYFLEIVTPAAVDRDLCVDLVVIPAGEAPQVFQDVAVVFTIPSDPVTTTVDLVYGSDPGA
ncbi:MAG: hypothetical protein JSU98_01625 [Gemmatimonadales bacterium]|nr:MAG: hypothetical protein JSU98_01625 [Gemmatimonadales bacterium]